MRDNTFKPEQYQALWREKVARTLDLFNDVDIPEPQLFSSPKSHFRMRAEFKIWHEGDEWNYVMFEPKNKREHYNITRFPIAYPSIEALMPRLRATIMGNDLLNKRLFQIEFLASTTDDMLVTLIYHKKLGDEWLNEAKSLGQLLNIKVIGRAKKQKRCTDDDWIIETLNVNGCDYHYQQVEASFTQPNAAINTDMLSWACLQAGYNSDDLLELYCGNGNFSLPLSKHFRQVLATEISKTSIYSALYNCDLNRINNIKFLRMSSEEFTEAMNGVREFRRLKNLTLSDYSLNSVLVDPPRAGLDDGTIKLISQFDRIFYISCNPQTLVNNLQALQAKFTISALAFFDQFPYTDHIESGVVLTKR